MGGGVGGVAKRGEEIHCSHTPSFLASPVDRHRLCSFQIVLSLRKAPPRGPLHAVLGDEGGLPLLLYSTPTILPFALSFHVLLWLSKSCLLSSTALPSPCHMPVPPRAEHKEQGDDAGRGSALQALIL